MMRRLFEKMFGQSFAGFDELEGKAGLFRRFLRPNKVEPSPEFLTKNQKKFVLSLGEGVRKRVAFTLAEGATHIRNFANSRKFAFTLAEVLITIGIIGVVAAMTIPVLSTSIQKHKVETALKKFNSSMNQAIRLSVAENGDSSGWVNVGVSYTQEECLAFLKQYILPYIKYSRVYPCSSINQGGANCVEMSDGSTFSLQIDYNGGDVIYWLNPRLKGSAKDSPRNRFPFQFFKRQGNGKEFKSNSQLTFEPYMFNWNGEYEQLYTGHGWSCKSKTVSQLYCTKLIEQSGWKIPKEYPW